MTSNPKLPMEKIFSVTQRTVQASFNEYDSVELKEDIFVDAKGGKTTLKKGEKGAIMMIYGGQSERVYEVDFPEKKVLAPVAESKLQAAFETDW